MAYEVLGDEKKRKIYDRYGLMGLQMYSSYASAGVMGQVLFSPALMCLMFILLTIILSVAIMFPAFLSVKIDGKVLWNWASVFSPLWILDIFGLIYFVVGVCSKETPEQRPEGEEDDHMVEPEGKRRILPGLYSLFKFVLFVLWQIFIVVKISLPEDAHTGWTWAKVWIPIFVLEGLFFFELLLECRAGFVILSQELEQKVTSGVKLLLIVNAFRWWPFRVLQSIFIVIRADEVVTWNWAIVAIPILVGLFLTSVFDYIYLSRLKQKATSDEQKSEIKSSLCIKTIFNVIVLTFSIAFIGMLIVYLNDHQRTMAVVLVPFFIVIGFLLCCCCCCLPLIYCLSGPSGSGDDIEAGIMRATISLTVPLLEPGPGNTQKWTIDDP